MFHQNEKHRKHYIGNFRTLLREMTMDPAMMIYLDLEDSDRAKPNENYPRELYELFALGIGNYSQSDMMETARAISGLVLDAPPGVPKPTRISEPETNRRFTRDGITTRLEPSLHDDGVKSVLGRKGNLGVDEIVDIACEQNACGDFLSAKLIAYFGAVDNGNALRDRMSTAFRKSGFEISLMLRVLFTSPEFYSDESRLRLLSGTAQALESSEIGSSGERVLVLVQLAGGNDGLNTLVPYADDIYYRSRPKLSIANVNVHKIDDYAGFHLKMYAIKDLWDSGLLSMVQNVGYPNPDLL